MSSPYFVAAAEDAAVYLADFPRTGRVLPGRITREDPNPGGAKFEAWALGLDGSETRVRAYVDGAVEGMACPLFAYGTLMTGECRRGALGAARFAGPAKAAGRLFDFGDYPGMVAWRGEWVRGELLRLADPEQVFPAADRAEGFRGFGKPGSWFRRALLEARIRGARPEPAWVYLLAGAPGGAPRISGGDWRRVRRP